jgi:UDP-GlcNAc:undecaprenyl-phosphate GlcNAc-1-phosphate transferase
MLDLVLVFVLAAGLSFLVAPLVRRLAVAWRAIDLPDARKIHMEPVPRLGGVAVALAAALATAGFLATDPGVRSAVFGGLGAGRWSVLVVAALVALAIGIWDDLRGLSAPVKLVAEAGAAAAVVAIAGAPRAVDLAPFAGAVDLGPLVPLLGVLWIVTITNAFNWTDVVDGVAAGVGALAAATLALVCATLGKVVPTTILVAVAGALVGFLPRNFGSPRIFLGDSGSLGVGFLLGAASWVGLEREGAWLAVPAALALAVPLAECGLTMLRRTLRALSVVRLDGPRERFQLRWGSPGWFVPDRRHVPHRLLELGLGPRATAGALYVAAALLGVMAYATVRWAWLGPVAGLVVLATLLWLAPGWLYEELRLLDRGTFLPFFEHALVRSRVVHGVYDGVLLSASYLVTGAVGTGGGFSHLQATVITGATGLLGFGLAGLYRGAYRYAGLAEGLRIGRAVLFGVVLSAAVQLLVVGRELVPAAWLLHLFVSLTALAGARLSFRLLDHFHQRGRLTGRPALILGTGRLAQLALENLLGNVAWGLVPVGFVDDERRNGRAELEGYPVYRGGDELPGVLDALQVDDLVIATHQSITPRRLASLADICRNRGIRLSHFGLQWDAGGSELPPAAASGAGGAR